MEYQIISESIPKRKGGTRKIRDLDPQEFCTDPEHGPATFKVFNPGVYEHTCPRCGKTIQFTIPLKY